MPRPFRFVIFFLVGWFSILLHGVASPGKELTPAEHPFFLVTDDPSATKTPRDSVWLPSFLPDTVWVSINEPNFRFILAEDSLRVMAREVVETANDSLRMANNDRFIDFLTAVIEREGGMAYPFDSLKTVSMLTPPDSAFRIITWYVPLSGRQFRYFGLAQAAGPSHEKKEIYRLVERDADEGQATEAEFTHDAWYAALYYELVMNTHHGENHYVLLGWRGDNPLTRKRIIEPFSLREGKPVFGARVFDMDGQQPCRVIFEYSSRVNMGLLYDRQYPGFGSRERVPMIVFDRLEPMEEAFRGQRQYYVPEGNIFDAFFFVEGRWQLRKDVDARKHPETD